ncbi:MAG: PAS domain-containing protein [Phycisphaerales bacterium]
MEWFRAGGAEGVLLKHGARTMRRQYSGATDISQTEGRQPQQIRVPKTRRGNAVHKDKQVVPAELDENTEQKRAIAALHATEEKYRLAMDATADCVCDWNVTTGVVDYSPALKTILGLEEVKNTYETWVSRIHLIGTMTDISERKRVESEMMNSRSLLNSIIEQSPSPTWISDDNGTLIRINKACCDMLRITPEEVVGKYNVMEDRLVEKQGMMPLV